MGIGGEETKHDTSSKSQQQQPLTQQQVLQHLSTLQKRMGQMQSFAKGLTDQAQQDKIKITTLQQQLEAAKTLQWAKQRTSPKTTNTKRASLDMKDLRGPLPPAKPKAHISNPRLEEIRKFRQEREEKLRYQFAHSSDVNDLARPEHHHNQELEDKLQALQAKYEALQSENGSLQAENTNILLEHTESLAEKQDQINKYQEEMKALEELIEESYHERESLERKVIKSTNKKAALSLQIERFEAIASELKTRDEENTLLLIQAHATEDHLEEFLVDKSLEALVGREEQDELIQKLESMVETLEHQLEKASRYQPLEGENDQVEILKKQLKDQEEHFHTETIDMEVELMDANEFSQMQRLMLDAQEMELLLLSNDLADLEKHHPLARSLSGGNLFSINEEESEVNKSLDEDEGTAREQADTAQHSILPPSPLTKDELPQQTKEQANKAAKLKREQEEKEIKELANKAHLLTLNKNIYRLSRKFEWQLQRREELEEKVKKMKVAFDNLSAKYVKSEDELKTLKSGKPSRKHYALVTLPVDVEPGQKMHVRASTGQLNEVIVPPGMKPGSTITVEFEELEGGEKNLDTSNLSNSASGSGSVSISDSDSDSPAVSISDSDSDSQDQGEKASATENVTQSLTRQLMRASMSIRNLQQELKTSKQQSTQLEKELQKTAPAVEMREESIVAELKAQVDEQTETNELLKEFMQDMKVSHEDEREKWNAQQQELNQKIEQLSLELKRRSGDDKDFSSSSSPPPPPPPQSSSTPRSAMDRLEATTPANSAQESPSFIASPPKTPLQKEWMTEISVVRSEISRLKQTLQSKQPQNESFPVAMNENGSKTSDDYIFADRSEDDINTENVTTKRSGSISSSEKWYREVTALKQELNDLTLELRKSPHHENKVSTPPSSPSPLQWKKSPNGAWMKGRVNPVQTGPELEDTSSVGSSTTGGFENEILLLRKEVDRQQEQQKNVFSPHSAASSAGSNTSPNQVYPAGSSLVSSLEGDASFFESLAFSEL